MYQCVGIGSKSKFLVPCNFVEGVFYCEGTRTGCIMAVAISRHVSLVSVLIFELRSNVASVMARRNHFSQFL